MTDPWTAGPLRRAGTADLARSNGRVIRYTLSDPSVARDGHTIARNAWVLDNFLKNPVVLWAHDNGEPPIGRMVEIATVGDRLMGSVEYPEAETYPFADTVFRLVKEGYLNATSVSWIPLDWKYSTDRSRPGGIDFTRVELLEVSQVPVPALPGALAEARARGIDTEPLYQWAERILDNGGSVIMPRVALEELRRAARMPTALPRAEAIKPDRAVAFRQLQRDLYGVTWLADALACLACLEEYVEWEAGMEGDSSPIPDRLAAVLRTLGQILVDMTIEEVGELFAAEDLADRGTPAQRLVRALGRGIAGKPLVPPPMAPMGEAPVVRVGSDAARIMAAALARAGRVLSAENEAKLRAAHEQLIQGAEMIRAVLDLAAEPAPEPAAEPDELEAGLQRAREAVARLREAA